MYFTLHIWHDGLGLFSFLLSGVILSAKEWNDGVDSLLGAVMQQGLFVGFFPR